MTGTQEQKPQDQKPLALSLLPLDILDIILCDDGLTLKDLVSVGR